MKVLDIKLLEDCFDGSFIKEFLLDKCISKELIMYLGKEGALQYFPTFARPFFKLDVPGKYSIKGIEGNITIRILLSGADIENSQRSIVDTINGFQDNL